MQCHGVNIIYVTSVVLLPTCVTLSDVNQILSAQWLCNCARLSNQALAGPLLAGVQCKVGGHIELIRQAMCIAKATTVAIILVKSSTQLQIQMRTTLYLFYYAQGVCAVPIHSCRSMSHSQNRCDQLLLTQTCQPTNNVNK